MFYAFLIVVAFLLALIIGVDSAVIYQRWIKGHEKEFHSFYLFFSWSACFPFLVFLIQDVNAWTDAYKKAVPTLTGMVNVTVPGFDMNLVKWQLIVSAVGFIYCIFVLMVFSLPKVKEYRGEI